MKRKKVEVLKMDVSEIKYMWTISVEEIVSRRATSKVKVKTDSLRDSDMEQPKTRQTREVHSWCIIVTLYGIITFVYRF